MGTMADMLMGRQVSDLSPDELAQLTQMQEADRMAAGGQGDPTKAVQDIQQMVQAGTQNPPPDSSGILGGLVRMLTPLFAGPQPQPQQAPPAPAPTPGMIFSPQEAGDAAIDAQKKREQFIR